MIQRPQVAIWHDTETGQRRYSLRIGGVGGDEFAVEECRRPLDRYRPISCSVSWMDRDYYYKYTTPDLLRVTGWGSPQIYWLRLPTVAAFRMAALFESVLYDAPMDEK